MRAEFPSKVRVAAFRRADGHCENRSCGAFLLSRRFHYDHVIPDALGGEPTLENCEVLCWVCHDSKTRTEDVPRIAKAKRQEAAQIGAKTRRGPPIPGSKASGLRKRMNGQVERRT